jgi:hypothetical protein
MMYIIETMRYLAPGGNRTCGLTTSVKNIFAFVMLGGVRSCKDARLYISPGAVIKRFLLKGSDKSARGKKGISHDLTWHQRISALGYASR